MAKAKRTEQITEAVDYKLQGHTYEMIAEQMKLTPQQVVELVYEGLASLIQDDSNHAILLDLSRIDQMIAAVYPNAAGGDVDSIRTVMVLRRERDAVETKLRRLESLTALAPVEEEDVPVTKQKRKARP